MGRFGDDGLTKFKAAQAKMIAKSTSSWDTYYGYRTEKLREYTIEEVQRVIDSASLEEQIRLSRNFFARDGFYKRIIIYYATLLKYAGILIPQLAPGKHLSNHNLQKQYFKTMQYIEDLNLPEFFAQCSLNVFRDGGYYGIITQVDKNTFQKIDLPASYCRSRFKDVNGNDVLEFNVLYFNTIVNTDVREETISLYPKVVSNYYRRYCKGKATTPWVIVPSDLGLCFTLFDDCRPLFLNVIPSTIQYAEQVELEQERDLEEIRKIIIQKIPHLNDGQLLFEPDEAEEMHAGTVGMLGGNKNISVITTYADVDSIVSKTSSDAVSNNLEKMMNNIYYQASASAQIFAPNGNMSVAISIKNDLSLVMVLAAKYDHFINYLINRLYANSNISFKYETLPISYYNDEDYLRNSLNLAKQGYSLILPSIALGLGQNDIRGIKELENDVLGLTELLVTPAAAQAREQAEAEQAKEAEAGAEEDSNSVTGERGRPALKDEDKAPKTLQNEQSIDNQGGTK